MKEVISLKTNNLRNVYERYFQFNIISIINALKSINYDQFEKLISSSQRTLLNNRKIVVTGLGKNVPICEKFVGSMISMGLNASFMNTNSAVHGDMGIVKDGDLVIFLTKSGSTKESVYLFDMLKYRNGVDFWLLCFEKESKLSATIENKIILELDHEGDLWNIMPINSSSLYLLVLQVLAIELSKRLELKLQKDFKPNHPGGSIGDKLNNV